MKQKSINKNTSKKLTSKSNAIIDSSLPNLDCSSWILMDARTGKEIGSSNNIPGKIPPRRALPIASVSKILTALVVMETLDNGGKVELGNPALYEKKIPISERVSKTTGTSARLRVSSEHPRMIDYCNLYDNNMTLRVM